MKKRVVHFSFFVLLIVSLFGTIQGFAVNNDDTKFTFNFTNGAPAKTEGRLKEDDSGVYMRVTQYGGPYTAYVEGSRSLTSGYKDLSEGYYYRITSTGTIGSNKYVMRNWVHDFEYKYARIYASPEGGYGTGHRSIGLWSPDRV